MRIFFTGDTHGGLDMRKLGSRAWPLGKTLSAEDVLVILGDFGLPWANDATDKYWLGWLSAKPWTTVFIDGNHENFPLLSSFPVEMWHSGRAHILRRDYVGAPKVIHLMRGQLFRLRGRVFFTLGGAVSVDKPFRKEGVSWWAEELPSTDELNKAENTLWANGWRADYVLTHCAPSNIQYRLSPSFHPDRLTNFLFDVERRLNYHCWLFGHYHVDQAVSPRHLALYNAIYELVENANELALDGKGVIPFSNGDALLCVNEHPASLPSRLSEMRTQKPS